VGAATAQLAAPPPPENGMTRKKRKLVGAAVLVVFVPLYALVASVIGDLRMPQASALTQALYFAIAGLIWVIPAGLIITWMLRPDK
jgi:Protein of unknown function (DUF2842)